MKIVDTLINAAYKQSDVPAILRVFIEDFSKLSEDDNQMSFYIDPISMKIEEYMKLIDETDDNVNPFVSEMGIHAQNLKSKFKEAGFNHFDMKMRRKSLCSLFNKINKTMRDGKSIDSINDLVGMEITLHTRSDFDSEDTLKDLYNLSNLTLEYFSNSNEHKGSKFSLCDAEELKDTISTERTPEEVKTLKNLNSKIYLPAENMIEKRFRNFVKDYAFQPKLTTAYQGIQFVVKTENGIYFEIQLKTQPMRDYLDAEDSPGNHKNHKEKQIDSSDCEQLDCLQFNLEFDSKKMSHIDGYRPNVSFDRSGIVQAVKWDLRKSTHF